MSSELLNFKSVDEFKFCDLDDLQVECLLRVVLQSLDLLFEGEGVQFADGLWGELQVHQFLAVAFDYRGFKSQQSMEVGHNRQATCTT